MTMQQNFAARAVELRGNDDNLVGVAVAGSWVTNEIDEYSDLDMILVTKEKVGGNKEWMLKFAKQLPHFLSGFTGEHVGEPRVLICLYDDPLLHVDLKFVTLEEFRHRIETPVILLDKEGKLKLVLDQTEPVFPYPDFQWIEDRFWIWIHYALLKIGRGEYIEAYDFFSYLRMVVFGPLLHIKNGNLPRGVRKVETLLSAGDLQLIHSTLPAYSKEALFNSLHHSVALYRQLRDEVFTPGIIFQNKTEEKVMKYFKKIKMPSNN